MTNAQAPMTNEIPNSNDQNDIWTLSDWTFLGNLGLDIGIYDNIGS